MDWSNEPVRRNVWAAATIVALSTFFGALGLMESVTWQSVFVALGAALGQFGTIAFGAEAARHHAWGPKTVDDLMDAEAVITSAERRGG